MPNIISIAGTSAAASLTGLASNVTGATWTLSANDAGDSLAHKLTIRNDSVTDHSAKTAIVVGTGPNGEPQTKTYNLPGTSATITSADYWLSVSSVTPSATIGTDTMDIGWAADAVSAWYFPKTWPEHFSIGFGCVISGTPTYTVQHSYGDGAPFNHSVVAAKTANSDGSYSAPIAAIRLLFTAAGTVTLTAIQGGV